VEADPAQRLERRLEPRVAALGRSPGGRVQKVDGALIIGRAASELLIGVASAARSPW
jgi:hypothetical protein